MIEKSVNTGDKKFFFDQNIFDEDHIDPELLEEEEPPPPVFNESELEQAKKAAFEKGQLEASVKAKNSREQHLAVVMERVAQDAAKLFAQEAKREAVFEKESIALCISIFETVFPFYAERAGFDELKAAISDVLSKQAGQNSILVQTHPDYTDGVDEFLKSLSAQHPDLKFTVKANESLSDMECRLTWEHGGALHNPQGLAQTVLDSVKDTLASAPDTGHDNKEEQSDGEDADHSATGEAE